MCGNVFFSSLLNFITGLGFSFSRETVSSSGVFCWGKFSLESLLLLLVGLKRTPIIVYSKVE